MIQVLASNVETAAQDELLWFTMPRAKPFPGPSTMTVPELVRLLALVASTLADLAAAGIHHRDIKPSNLLMLAESPVVADFGLVTTPGDVGDLTARRDKLGSNFYVPSELINDPASADSGPADVFSLGKTIWVVLTGEAYPPNQLDGVAALAGLLPTEPRISEVDSLLTAMTAEDPAARPSMAFVSRELSACVQSSNGGHGASWPHLSDLIESTLLHDHAATHELRNHEVQKAAIDGALGRLASRCEETLRILEGAGAPVHRTYGSHYFQYDGSDLLAIVQGPTPIASNSGESSEVRECHASVIRGSERQPCLRYFVGVIKRSGDLEGTFTTGCAITYWGGRTVVLHAGARSCLIGGPSETAAIEDLALAMGGRVESDLLAWREATINASS